MNDKANMNDDKSLCNRHCARRDPFFFSLLHYLSATSEILRWENKMLMCVSVYMDSLNIQLILSSIIITSIDNNNNIY